LQADITSLLKTPINFATDGFSLAPESKRLVAQIADKVKACPDVKLSVVGHTDNTGNDAINVPLSGSRAKSVADELVSDGVTAGGVTSSGAGSANPVASNATPDGRAQNRRVEITVS
jgi:peptidoglycan-binding protein ArfA